MSLSVAGPLQTTVTLNGEWGRPAGVIPAHVHCFAWVEVLGIVSAEFLSRAVTDADRPDLPLALPLFRQVFLQRKQLQPYFQLRCSQRWRSEEKSISVQIMPGKGEAFDGLAKVKGNLCQNEFVCLLLQWLRVNNYVCVSWFWCMLTLLSGTHRCTSIYTNFTVFLFRFN